MIRPVTAEDVETIRSIYNYYIENTVITFEENALTLSEMQERVQTISSKFPYLVLEEDGEVVGYAYANTWRTRNAYRFSCETSIYLRHGLDGRGRGQRLYEALLCQLREQGFHLLVGGITLPNEKSVRLHEKLGFKKVGEFSEAGWKFDQWLDVGFWQLVFPSLVRD